MTYSKAVPRPALRKVALGLGAVVAASLAFTGAASADIINATADGSNGTNNLGQAIATANANSSSSNTIVLAHGTYSPPAGITITKNLTIVGNHAASAIVSSANVIINGSLQGSVAPGNELTVNPGVTLTLEAVAVTNGGGSGFYQIDDQGNLVTYGVNFSGAPGGSIDVDGASASATLNESSVFAAVQDGIDSSGALTLNNVDDVRNAQLGIAASSGSVTLNNTLLALNSTHSCVLGVAVTGQGSMDDDGTCQVTTNAAVDTSFPAVARTNPASPNGGPTPTFTLPAGSPAIGAGVAALCPTTDQRFFVNSPGACDIGSENGTNATKETSASAPTCAVTNLITGPPAQQQVTVTDTASGMGPESGAASDVQPGAGGIANTGSTTASAAQTLPTATLNVTSTAGFPSSGTLAVMNSGTPASTPGSSVVYVTYTGTTATSFTGVSGGSGSVASGATVNGVNTPGIAAPITAPFTPNPADAITNLFISNGTVSFTPFTFPSTSGLVLTATKTLAGTLTHWNFTATDWAGQSTACN
jgi:hypothetical protein